MNIIPDLAERWEARDPQTYVFQLRKGVKFHDGRPCTSADVKFTFDSILSGQIKTPKRGAYEIVRFIEAPDPATVVFHLREPFASFLWNLTRPGIGIVPAGSGKEAAQHPIGTGPFRFAGMTLDEEIVLDRNPDYFGRAAQNCAGQVSHRAGRHRASARITERLTASPNSIRSVRTRWRPSESNRRW